MPLEQGHEGGFHLGILDLPERRIKKGLLEVGKKVTVLAHQVVIAVLDFEKSRLPGLEMVPIGSNTNLVAKGDPVEFFPVEDQLRRVVVLAQNRRDGVFIGKWSAYQVARPSRQKQLANAVVDEEFQFLAKGPHAGFTILL